jgi:hypothetical protein
MIVCRVTPGLHLADRELLLGLVRSFQKLHSILNVGFGMYV